MTRNYLTNQILLIFVVSSLISIYVILWNYQLNNLQYLMLFGIITFLLHYHLNLVHLASHQLLSKNLKLNAFLGNVVATLGGVTFADFKTTHAIHHASPTSEKDPDKYIAENTPFLFMPFKIWQHDKYFWQQGLWEKNRNWLGYIISRLIQITLVLGFFISGKIELWMYFWLVPELIVGIFNGMFLFYFPHYTTNTEMNMRKDFDVDEHTYQLPTWSQYKEAKNLHSGFDISLLFSFGKFTVFKTCLTVINISRLYHEKHHLRITEEIAYFPLEHFLYQKIRGNWTEFVNQEKLQAKFTNISKNQVI